MPNPKEIKEELKAISAIKTITVTYQEVSQNKMNEIREEALKNREFIERLSRVYASAKIAYLNDDEAEPLKKKKGEVVVFISANARFYGSLLWDVWKTSSDYLKGKDADLVVIGDVGKYLVQNSDVGEDFSHFELHDEEPEKDQVKKIIEFIENYERITVFHGKFKNILKQESSKTNISGEAIDKDIDVDADYLFEPSPKEVLDFFEKELITAFFNQAFLEHRLSRHATRMVAMHRASENAKEEIEKLEQKKTRVKRQLLDKKQFEITAPYQLWK